MTRTILEPTCHRRRTTRRKNRCCCWCCCCWVATSGSTWVRRATNADGPPSWRFCCQMRTMTGSTRPMMAMSCWIVLLTGMHWRCWLVLHSRYSLNWATWRSCYCCWQSGETHTHGWEWGVYIWLEGGWTSDVSFRVGLRSWTLKRQVVGVNALAGLFLCSCVAFLKFFFFLYFHEKKIICKSFFSFW